MPVFALCNIFCSYFEFHIEFHSYYSFSYHCDIQLLPVYINVIVHNLGLKNCEQSILNMSSLVIVFFRFSHLFRELLYNCLDYFMFCH